MPRKKSTKTARKRDAGGDKSAPTATQWINMKPYASFVVTDSHDIPFKFMRGETATVLPHNRTPGQDVLPHEYWVVKIKEIRAIEHEDDTNDVWAKVQWYYSPEDVKSVIKSFDTNACGEYERIFSDHYDFVTPEAFNEVIIVAKLKDDDSEQPYISRTQFYCRYTFEKLARKLKPKPGSDTCICEVPYDPKDETTVMHFCPRPSCRKWYHQTCLIKAKSKEPAIPGRELRLLSTSPEADDPILLTAFLKKPRPKRRRKVKNKDESAATRELEEMLDEALGSIPEDLVRVAQQPIVRGAGYEKGGVSGNVRSVLQARMLVYQALGGEALEEWEEAVLSEISPITVEDLVVRIKGKRTIPALLCPECNSAI